MTVVGIVPIKLNNERLPGKNLAPMADGRSLLDRVLDTLVGTARFDRVYVYCSNPSIESLVTESGASFLRRSVDLDGSKVKSNDILQAFAAEVPATVYALVHATSPFLSAGSLCTGLDKVLHENFDSALAVTSLQTFVWRDSRPLNYDPRSIPRTQDLEPFLLETSGFYIFERDVLVNSGRRVGDRPFLVEVSKIEAIDVDEPEDFHIANALVAAGISG